MMHHIYHIYHLVQRGLVCALCFVALLLVSFLTAMSAHAAEDSSSRQVLMIVGFDGKAWHPYVASVPEKGEIKRRHWIKIKNIVDPVGITRQPGSGDLFVKGNDGGLEYYSATKRSLSPLLALTDKAGDGNYTQLRAYDEGLTMVRLLAGKSRDTQLLVVKTAKNTDVSANIPAPLLKQASAQFHPLIHQQTLFYAHVSCRLACKPVVQEVWMQNLITGKALQLTLLNATSYLHSVDEEGHVGFLSSNKRGYYHLARLDLNTKDVTWLTQGKVTDSFPSIAHNGDLYFIRRTAQGAQLMALENARNVAVEVAEHGGELKAIALPKSIKKIRYLELSNQ